jgi:Mn-dependent DtxR family transcriptional regulator
MRRIRYPPPSRSAQRVIEYLDIVKSAQAKQGMAKRYDFVKRAMNEAQAGRMIKYLKESDFIKGNDDDGYIMTKNGEIWYEILKKHRDLVGLLTTELSGDRIRRW